MAKRRPYQRTERLGSVIREVLSVAVMREARADSLRNVIVTGVDVTRDLSVARVHYYLMGDDTAEMRALVHSDLEHAAGYLRHKVGEQVRMRITPELRFHFDDSVERARRIEEVLADLPELVPDAPVQAQADEATDPSDPDLP